MSERGIQPGTILYGTYVVDEVLGEGGFGITYRATRKESGEIFAIKEYFPFQIASRKKDSGEVVVAKTETAEYMHGKERFMKEASILQEYQYLKGIVKVWDCFEANNTAYIVMGYIEGITLKEYISSHGQMEYEEVIGMLSPVLKALIALHKHGLIHRDISPDNLMIGLDNQVYLIDFGAVKEMDYRKTTTVLLKAGYAPPEQYLHDGDMGAWTDVYALCATIYTALSGKIPVDAVARLQGKELIPLSEYGVKLEAWQTSALWKGMYMRAAERFRDVEQLYDALTIAPSDEEIKTMVEPELDAFAQTKLEQFHEKEVRLQKRKWASKLGAAMLGVFLVGLVVAYGNGYFVKGENEKQNRQENTVDAIQEKKLQTNPNQQTQEKISTEEKQEKLCSMPNVVGMTKENAIQSITAQDKTILIHIERKYDANVPVDSVIEQSVKADTLYNEGAITEITLIVSDGKAPVTKPSSKQNEKGDYFDIESEEDKGVEFYFD